MEFNFKNNIDRFTNANSFLKSFKQLWRKYPYLRFYQLVQLLEDEANKKNKDIFYMENHELEQLIQIILKSS